MRSPKRSAPRYGDVHDGVAGAETCWFRLPGTVTEEDDRVLMGARGPVALPSISFDPLPNLAASRSDPSPIDPLPTSPLRGPTCVRTRALAPLSQEARENAGGQRDPQ